MKVRLITSGLGVVLLTGCAGYNHTMFMTKSNAGLDFDAKPPTAEISISRKEAVISPAFEKGQTPPVMASFKPDTGFGGAFKNYFVGVNQTFAGGDAAKTMAVLYDSPTFRASDDSVFDSTLDLDTPITGTNRLFDPAPPGKVRPFIFGTDTSLGLKVAWSGAGGQFPDSLKAGFNRKEFAWAPITKSADGKKVKMPSFLATIESRIGGGSDTNQPAGTNGVNPYGGISAIQYFATGEAASQLARQKEVRVAMLKRLDPEYVMKPKLGTGIVARQMLDAMQNALNQLGSSDPPDAIAATFDRRLNDLKGVQVPVSFETAKPPLFYYARINGETNVFKKLTKYPPNPKGASSAVALSDATTHLASLESSITVLKSIQTELVRNTNGVFLLVDNSTNWQPILATNALEIAEQYQTQRIEHARTENELLADHDVSAAFDYFKSLTQ